MLLLHPQPHCRFVELKILGQTPCRRLLQSLQATTGGVSWAPAQQTAPTTSSCGPAGPACRLCTKGPELVLQTGMPLAQGVLQRGGIHSLQHDLCASKPTIAAQTPARTVEAANERGRWQAKILRNLSLRCVEVAHWLGYIGLGGHIALHRPFQIVSCEPGVFGLLQDQTRGAATILFFLKSGLPLRRPLCSA